MERADHAFRGVCVFLHVCVCVCVCECVRVRALTCVRACALVRVCLMVFHLGTSKLRRPGPELDCSTPQKNIFFRYLLFDTFQTACYL